VNVALKSSIIVLLLAFFRIYLFIGPGDAAVIPTGHNAWVVGNEPVVGIDFTGLKEYAKSG